MLSTALAGAAIPKWASAQAPQPGLAPVSIVFQNVKVFDGTRRLREGLSVRVADDKIVDMIEGNPGPIPKGWTVIDCKGMTLIPGLIDGHWHTMMASMLQAQLASADVGTIHIAAAVEAEKTLLRGFTTVRDLGGPAFALKKAIDTGVIPGPRIYPSGAMISQTSGHGDFRAAFETPRTGAILARPEVLGIAVIADSADEVRRRTREQLMAGASQIKLMAGGGVASSLDPIDVTQYRLEELKAGVEAADDWGTYVATHVYDHKGIARCIEAGVKCIDHGQLANIRSVEMMVKNDTYWSLQPFAPELNANLDKLDPATKEKWEVVWQGTKKAYNLAKGSSVKIGWGTDILFSPEGTKTQGRLLAAMKSSFDFAEHEVLNMATSGNAAILKLSGERDPYKTRQSPLGAVVKNAWADLLLVNGNPLQNINLIEDPEQNFKIIMKGGKIYKNTLGTT